MSQKNKTYATKDRRQKYSILSLVLHINWLEKKSVALKLLNFHKKWREIFDMIYFFMIMIDQF